MSTSISAPRLQPHCTPGPCRRMWLLGTPSHYCRRMRILAAIDSPDAIQKILACLGLPTRAPPVEQAQPHTNEAILW